MAGEPSWDDLLGTGAQQTPPSIPPLVEPPIPPAPLASDAGASTGSEISPEPDLPAASAGGWSLDATPGAPLWPTASSPAPAAASAPDSGWPGSFQPDPAWPAAAATPGTGSPDEPPAAPVVPLAEDTASDTAMAPAGEVSWPFAAPVSAASAAAPDSGASILPSAASEAAQASNEDPFASLFGGDAAAPVAAGAAPAPLSRREMRESEGRRRGDDVRGSGGGSGAGGSGGPGDGSRFDRQPRPRRRLRWLAITLPIVLVLGVGAGVAWWGWTNYESQIRELFGWQLPNDYEGSGNGTEVIVTIRSGDIGSDVATTLHAAGVTMTYDAVYDLLLENPDIGFTPGNWRLQEQMSAQSAVDALQDPANKVTSQLLITEGSVLPDVLEIIASTTGISLEDVQAAAANPQAYGVPAEAPSLEGYLFPATYELDGGETAEQIIQMLVDTMFEHLDSFGVAPEQRHTVLTMASIIQREAGSNIADFYKVSRVFQNRIDQDINLESDATVAYGTGRLHTVWTEPEERADASNPYNTYANPGLPIGPIGMPGDDAIDAALHPADGPWLFFVPINLATGETVFSETVEEHDAAVEQLLAWCRESDENATYCE